MCLGLYLQVGGLGQAPPTLIVEVLAGENRKKNPVGTVKQEVVLRMMDPVTRVVTIVTPGTTTMLKRTGKEGLSFQPYPGMGCLLGTELIKVSESLFQSLIQVL